MQSQYTQKGYKHFDFPHLENSELFIHLLYIFKLSYFEHVIQQTRHKINYIKLC